jgi:predicted nucleotidyltransferase
MGIKELLKEKREEILRIAAKHGARNVRVFGSVARDEADEGAISICLWSWNPAEA